MTREMEEIPVDLQSTVKMLRHAYPTGIAEEDYWPLLLTMRRTGMSNRAVAFSILRIRAGTMSTISTRLRTCYPQRRFLRATSSV
jgi:hypothetical protein